MDFVPFKQVDVFTRRPFLGNPVAVVLDAAALSGAAMQRIAAWTNLSETTFVLPPSSAAADYRLRIFTPKQELSFAGHPTIGSAHAVLESGRAAPRGGMLKQECRAGLIELELERGSDSYRIFCKAPRAAIAELDAQLSREFAAAISRDSPGRPLRVEVGVTWLVGDLENSETVAALMPQLDQVEALSRKTQAAGITVFGRPRNESGKLHVRSFAPLLGVAEDPVCGSGNAAVAAYLARTGLVQEIGAEYSALQGMALGRAGEVAVRIRDREIYIGGFAVTCIDSRLRIS